MKTIITAKLKSKKGKDIAKKTFEYWRLLYDPNYAKQMVAQKENAHKK